MAFDTRELEVKITGDTSGFQRAVAEVQGTKGVGGIKNAFDNAKAGSFALLGGIAALGVGMGIATKSFIESENTLAQLDAVLKSTGGAAGFTRDEAISLSKALERTTTFSDEAVLSVENLLLTFTTIGKDSIPAATEAALNMSIALGQDTKSSAIQLGKALQDPINGITALRRVGVNFNDAQKEVITNLVNTGRQAEAQALILKELNTEFGGSAKKAAETFGGQLKQLWNIFDDGMEVVGGFVAGALRPLIQGALDFINNAGGIENIINNFLAALTGLQPYIPIFVGALIGGLVPAFVALAGAIWSAVAPLIPFLAIGAAIGAVVMLVVNAFGGWQATLTAFKPVIDNVLAAFRTMWNLFTAFVLPALTSLWNTIKNDLMPALTELWTQVSPVLAPALKYLAILIAGGVIASIVAFATFLTVLVKALSYVVQAISWVIDKAKALAGAIGGALSDMYNAVTGFIGRFFQAGKALIDAFVDGIKRGFDAAKNAVKDGLGAIRNMLPFSDAKEGPLSDLTLSGQRFSETFAAGIRQGADSLRTSAQGALSVAAPAQAIATQPVVQAGGGGGSVEMTVNIGMYAGTEVEKQRIAREIWKSLLREARSSGDTLPLLGVNPQ